MMEHERQDRVEHWLDGLQSSGYRVTAPRRVVVEVLAGSDRALTATQIYDRGRAEYSSLGLVSVYRTLETLEQLHLIQRVHQPDGCQAYISAFSGHQHLLLCERCGLVEFFRGDNLDGLLSRVEQESRYQIREHWLQLFGLCEDCQAAVAAGADQEDPGRGNS